MEMNMFGRRKASWAILIAITLMVTVLQTSAELVCEWTGEFSNCSIQEQLDLAALPRNATKLSVYFKSGHKAELSEKAFPNLPNLRRLIVDLNYLNKDPHWAVFSRLTELTELTFIHKGIFNPRPLELPALLFSGLTNLQRITMNSVGLSKYEPSTFHNLASLQVLDVNHNWLTSMPSNSFNGTRNLGDLYLQNNHLNSVDGAFNGLNLNLLNIRQNHMTVITNLTFGNLSIKTLNLRENRIERIEPYAFNGISSLMTLYMNENKLKEIGDYSFSGLNTLTSLKLQYNNLRIISPMAFHGIAKLNLIILHINNNNLTELSNDTFRGLDPQLLHLNSNNLRWISFGVFKDMKQLHYLNLSDNHLTTLPEGILDLLPMNGVDLSKNPWNCTCGITWIYGQTNEGENIVKKHDTKCDNLHDTTLLKYARTNFEICKNVYTSTTVSVKTTSKPVTEVITSALPSGEGTRASVIDRDLVTTNGTYLKYAGLGKTNLIVLICAGGGVFLLAVIIAVLIIYCKQKKCAFWAPERVAAIPSTPGELEKDINHFAYSPSKDRSFFCNDIRGNIDRKAKTGSVRIDRHSGVDSAYDNPALYLDDSNPIHVPHLANPAVVAYITDNNLARQNGAARKHSYEHRVSDNGTHYVDRALYPSAAENIHLNDLSPPSDDSNNQLNINQRSHRQNQEECNQKPSVSSSDNGEDDPYTEVYAPPTDIPLTKIPPTPAPRPSLLKKRANEISIDTPDSNTSQDYISQSLERDSALGASTEDPFEDDPQSPDPLTHNISNVSHLDDDQYQELDEGEDADHRRLQHTNSLGGQSDYMEEDKPMC